MVATWTPAASATYYTGQTRYYLNGSNEEPAGTWHAPSGSFDVVDGSRVDPVSFEHLFAGRASDGSSFASSRGSRLNRVPAFDVTLSAPRSVSLVWALGDEKTRATIERAQAIAVRCTLVLLEQEACYARRGRAGHSIERVPLTAALFAHGESRPAEHEDGECFADPNLHTHCVVLNLAPRVDGSVGALHSTILRDFKMAAGAIYHAALAAELQSFGYAIDRIGKNGVFEIGGVEERPIRYFSARRAEIEAELKAAGTTSGASVGLAAAVAKTSRKEKRRSSQPRDTEWHRAAERIGIDIDILMEKVGTMGRSIPPPLRAQELRTRIEEIPTELTRTRSVLERRDIIRSLAEAMVGTGHNAEPVPQVIDGLCHQGSVVKLGCDALGLPRYSTAETIRVEREAFEIAKRLASSGDRIVPTERIETACRSHGLSREQCDAVVAATAATRLAIIEGAPGTGKTTLLKPLIEAVRNNGFRVVGAATAWRVANALKDDLGIESRATASWIAGVEHRRPFLDSSTMFIVDEAGLLSSIEMREILTEAERSGARVLLVGDRRQLQAIGAGSGLSIAARAVEASRIETIVRQRESWAREAVAAIGKDQVADALDAFSSRGLLFEADGQREAISTVAAKVRHSFAHASPDLQLAIVKTNAEAMAVGRCVRAYLREDGGIGRDDVTIDAVTPSGHSVNLALAVGDRVRFLSRCDRIGVVNGTEAVIEQIEVASQAERRAHARVVARIGQRIVRFDTAEFADEIGRARIGWSYATTIYGSQGMTVENAVVLLTPGFDRQETYVALSRARAETLLVTDRRAIDREMGVGGAMPANVPDERTAARRLWLSERLSRGRIKETTLDSVVDREVVPVRDGSEYRAERYDEAVRTKMSDTRHPLLPAIERAPFEQGASHDL